VHLPSSEASEEALELPQGVVIPHQAIKTA